MLKIEWKLNALEWLATSQIQNKFFKKYIHTTYVPYILTYSMVLIFQKIKNGLLSADNPQHSNWWVWFCISEFRNEISFENWKGNPDFLIFLEIWIFYFICQILSFLKLLEFNFCFYFFQIDFLTLKIISGKKLLMPRGCNFCR